MSWEAKRRHARAAMRAMGRAMKRGDCARARKERSVAIKAISQLRDLVGGRPEVKRLERGLDRSAAKLERCYIRTGYHPAGR